VATSRNNLAELYRAQGQYAKAEPLYKRSLAIREKALGPEPPYVAQSLGNMAVLYRATNREKEAEAVEKREAAIQAIKR
jgi:tetratricopeptide (TPR) repeat protein